MLLPLHQTTTNWLYWMASDDRPMMLVLFWPVNDSDDDVSCLCQRTNTVLQVAESRWWDVHFMHCRYVVIATGCASCPKLTCERPGCGTLFCYHCKQTWHPNQTCDAARAERLANARSSFSCSQDSSSHSLYCLLLWISCLFCYFSNNLSSVLSSFLFNIKFP